QARVKMANAVKELIDAIGVLKGEGINSEEGKAIVAALKTLGPMTPEVAEGLGRADLLSMLSQAPGVRPGGGPPGMAGAAPRPMMIGGPRYKETCHDPSSPDALRMAPQHRPRGLEGPLGASGYRRSRSARPEEEKFHVLESCALPPVRRRLRRPETGGRQGAEHSG